jgi:hypothetical protein
MAEACKSKADECGHQLAPFAKDGCTANELTRFKTLSKAILDFIRK